MTQIFFDLDGTLIDCSKRSYVVYKKLVSKFGGTPLVFKKYWQLKISKTDSSKILYMSGIGGEKRSKYLLEFLKLIEHPSSLKLNRSFFYTKRVLRKLIKKGWFLYLISFRQSKKNTLRELERLNLKRFFKEIRVGKSKKDVVKTKTAYIKSLLNHGKKALVVGDTEDDILAAKELRIQSIAVLSGIRSKKRLQGFSPTYLVKDIRGVLDIVDRLGNSS